MCSICMKCPCDPRCPNAPAPKGIDTCPCCSDEITLGEEYADIDGIKYHVDCLEDMPIRELLQLFDVCTYTVEEEDIE